MQDYSKLYQSRILGRKKCSKLKQIERLLLSGLRPELVVFLIAAVIFPNEVVSYFRR
jgi:hypothetical protein